MFTWICPKCGREVPPAYAECPTCIERQQAAAAPSARPPAYGAPAPPPSYGAPAQPPVAAPPPPPVYVQPAVAPPPPPPPSYSAPPVVAPPAAAQAPPPPAYPPPPPPAPRSGIPAWLVAVGVAAVLIGALALLYKFVLNGDKPTGAAPPPAAATPADVTATTASGEAHPYARSLEITGIRILEDKNKVQVRFAAVNHSLADMAGLAIRGTLHATAAKPGDPPVATFEAQIGTLAANESRDVTAPATTKLRAYELPDWQFLRAQIEITSPR